VLSSDVRPDYFLFWDDDNLYDPAALSLVAAAVVRERRPDVLLVGMSYQGRVLPPAGVAACDITTGQIDTACIVVRPELAAAAYAGLLERKATAPDTPFYTQDFEEFKRIRTSVPAPRVRIAREIVVGIHDGLRWLPYIRHRLGMGPVGVAGKPWVKAIVKWWTRKRSKTTGVTSEPRCEDKS